MVLLGRNLEGESAGSCVCISLNQAKKTKKKMRGTSFMAQGDEGLDRKGHFKATSGLPGPTCCSK